MPKKKEEELFNNLDEDQEDIEETGEDEEAQEGANSEELDEGSAPPAEKDADKGEQEKTINIDDLTSKLEELERANKGLRDAIVNIRTEKQTLAAKLEQLSSMLMSAKEQRQQQLGGDGETQQKMPDKIKVEVTDDGDLYIPPEVLDQYLKQKVQPLEQTVNSATQNVTQIQRTQQIQSLVNSVVERDPSYKEAYQTMLEAYKEMQDRAKMMALEKGLNPDYVLSNIDAIAAMTYGTEFEKKLNAMGVDVDDIVALDKTADPMVLPTRLERVLKRIAKRRNKGKEGNTDVENLDKLANKPTNLTGKRSSPPPSGEVTLDNIANTLSALDLLRMPDEKFNKLLEAAEE